MTKTLVLLLFILIGTSVQAQTYQYKYSNRKPIVKQNYLSIDYGAFSTLNLTIYLSSSVINYFLNEYGESIQHTGHSTFGPIGLSYMHRVNRIELGASFYYSKHALHFSGYQYGSPTLQTYGLLFDANFVYLSNPKLSLYSGVSIGPAYVHISNVVDDVIVNKLKNYLGTAYLASHVNLFGIRYGKDFGITLETGFGHKGLFHFGIDYTF